MKPTQNTNGQAAETVVLKIEKLSSDGSGIARTDEGVFFAEGALPGERVVAEIVRRKKDFTLSRTVRILEPSPGRIEPRCPVFGLCGGCQLQHASYPFQLELKASIVRDALTRIGGFEPPEFECVPSPRQWAYRNKGSFPIKKIKGKPTAGFYQAGSHKLVRIDSCPVNAGPLNRLFAIMQTELPKLPLDAYDERQHQGALRHLVLRAGLNTGQTLVSLVINGRLDARAMNSIAGLSRPLKDIAALTLNHNSRPGNVILGDRTEALKGDGTITERLNDRTFVFDTSSFFQVNTDQAEHLYAYVGELAQGENALELYSGVGSLTCWLSHLNSVKAVEEWSSAVEFMKKNLALNGVTNVTPLQGKAEERIAELDGYDLVVMDPPRTGCERAVLDRIAEVRPRRVVYVSCNPSTLARDAKILRTAGYALKSVRAFDMFPQTVHVETVALLELE